MQGKILNRTQQLAGLGMPKLCGITLCPICHFMQGGGHLFCKLAGCQLTLSVMPVPNVWL